VRDLKTKSSTRDVPLVGAALVAAKELLVKAQSNSSSGLFINYFKPRGSDSFSATVNKRLKSKGFSKITTHCFRHALKDLLRNASVPKSLIDEIQGHGSQEISRSYGKGYSLDRKAESLMSAYALINAG
jgi:integrase